MSGGAENADLVPITPASFVTRSMGGRLAIHLDETVRTDETGGAEQARRATDAARLVANRIETWASRITRHDDASDLSRLNADPGRAVHVRPTLAAALAAGREATNMVPAYVNIALLDERLAAEAASAAVSPAVSPAVSRPSGLPDRPIDRAWTVTSGRRGTAVVSRAPGVRLDLGGVGKGWIADRALRLLGGHFLSGHLLGASAIVDADGDMAIRTARGRFWEIAVDDPRVPDGELAVLRIGSGVAARTWGIATSGTSIHRWQSPNADNQTPLRHHLIDPRTGLPAVTDVLQATVIAESALHAEAYAKAAVIAGSVRGFALLDRAPIRGAVLLLVDGRVLALPNTLALLHEAA